MAIFSADEVNDEQVNWVISLSRWTKASTKLRVPFLLSMLLCAASISLAAGDGLSVIPAVQRQALVARIGSYVAAFKARDWAQLYELVSSVGKGGAQKGEFVAAMQTRHGRDFAQMPDLLAFTPYKAYKASDGFDLYGCGKAQREGMKFAGIAVVHAVFEHGQWNFTGWSFTEFPNTPCTELNGRDWEPEGEMEFGQAMEELRDYRQRSGIPMHVDSPK